MSFKDGLKYFCRGMTEFGGKSYTFSFSENKVLLLPIEKYEHRYHAKGMNFRTFKNSWVVGKSLGTKGLIRKFYFFVDSIYDTPDDLEVVPRYIIEQQLSENDAEKVPNISQIHFMSREINTFVQDDFFSYYEGGKLKKGEQATKKYNAELFGSKCEIEIYSGMQKEHDTDQASSIVSTIKIKLSQEIEITEAVKYYDAIYRLLCFTNKRKNINIDRVLFGGAWLHCLNNFEETKFSIGNRYSNISLNCLGEQFPKLLELLSTDDNFKIFYLPRDEKTRDMERYIYTTALLEDVFRKFIIAKYHAEFEIKGRDAYWKNKKNKKGGSIKPKVTLKEKIQFCIDNYKSKLTFKTDSGKDMLVYPVIWRKEDEDYFDEISKRLSDIRNDIVHGSLKGSEYSRVASDLRFLEMIIYCIVLENVGLDDKMILFSICSVFDVGFKYTLFQEIIKESKV